MDAKCVSNFLSWIRLINFSKCSPFTLELSDTHNLYPEHIGSMLLLPNLRSQFHNENFKRHSSMREKVIYVYWFSFQLNSTPHRPTTTQRSPTLRFSAHTFVVSLSFSIMRGGRREWKSNFPSRQSALCFPHSRKFNKCHRRRRSFNYSYTIFMHQ